MCMFSSCLQIIWMHAKHMEYFIYWGIFLGWSVLCVLKMCWSCPDFPQCHWQRDQQCWLCLLWKVLLRSQLPGLLCFLQGIHKACPWVLLPPEHSSRVSREGTRGVWAPWTVWAEIQDLKFALKDKNQNKTRPNCCFAALHDWGNTLGYSGIRGPWVFVWMGDQASFSWCKWTQQVLVSLPSVGFLGAFSQQFSSQSVVPGRNCHCASWASCASC